MELFISHLIEDLACNVKYGDNGQDYVSQVLNKDEFREPKATAVIDGSLYVANQTTIGKLGLGATIDIAAGSNSNTITL